MRDSEIAVLVIDAETSLCDIGTGAKKPVRTFARELRTGVWKKLFGITGNVRPASHLQGAIDKPAKPGSWQAIQAQAKANTSILESAFKFIPRGITKDSRDIGYPASILPSWDAKKNLLASSLPFQNVFWINPRYEKTGESKIKDTKGFFCRLPTEWTSLENLDFKFPTSLVVKSDKYQKSESTGSIASKNVETESSNQTEHA